MEGGGGGGGGIFSVGHLCQCIFCQLPQILCICSPSFKFPPGNITIIQVSLTIVNYILHNHMTVI